MADIRIYFPDFGETEEDCTTFSSQHWRDRGDGKFDVDADELGGHFPEHEQENMQDDKATEVCISIDGRPFRRFLWRSEAVVNNSLSPVAEGE